MALQIPELFTAYKRESLEVCNGYAYSSALPVIERFADWKRDSWASADQHSCGSALPISKYFADWIRDYCAAANLLPGNMAFLIAEHFTASKRDSKEGDNGPLTGLHYAYLNDSQTESAIPEQQQLHLLPGWTAHIWLFRSLKTRFVKSN